MSIREIKSKYDYFRELNIEASVSGSYGAFSGSASFSYHSLEDIDENSVSWAITARSSYGSFSASHPEISPEYQKLKPFSLIQAYGPEYISEVDRGVLASVLYTFHSRSERFESELRAALSANFGGPGAGIGGGGSMSEMVKEASKYGTISIQVFTIGGKGTTELKNLVSQDPSDLPKVRDTLAKYVETEKITRSTVLGFRTTALGKLIGRSDIDPDYSPFLIFLDGYNNYRLRLQDLASRAYNIIVNQTDFQKVANITTVKALSDDINAELACINEKARLCRAWTDAMSRALANGDPAANAITSYVMKYGAASSQVDLTQSTFSVRGTTVRADPGHACSAEVTNKMRELSTKLIDAARPMRAEVTLPFNPCAIAVNASLFARVRDLPRLPFEVFYGYIGFKIVLGSTPPPRVLITLKNADKVNQAVLFGATAKGRQIIAFKSNDTHMSTVNFDADVSVLADGEKDVSLQVTTTSGATYDVGIQVPPRP